MSDPDPRSVLNSAGYLLQIAIERQISGERPGDWGVLVREHPWRKLMDRGEVLAEPRDGFIDLVLEKRLSHDVLVVECKRRLAKHWVFPCDRGMNRTHSTCFYSWPGQNDTRPELRWQDAQVLVPSPEAEFCAVHGSGDRESLEPIARDLLDAVESIAIEETNLARRNAPPPSARFYFPVIVTTANLFVCDATQAAISLEDGRLENGELQEVPVVRFRKNYRTTPVEASTARDLREIKREGEQTVFVVNARGLARFLEGWRTR